MVKTWSDGGWKEGFRTRGTSGILMASSLMWGINYNNNNKSTCVSWKGKDKEWVRRSSSFYVMLIWSKSKKRLIEREEKAGQIERIDESSFDDDTDWSGFQLKCSSAVIPFPPLYSLILFLVESYVFTDHIDIRIRRIMVMVMRIMSRAVSRRGKKRFVRHFLILNNK